MPSADSVPPVCLEVKEWIRHTREHHLKKSDLESLVGPTRFLILDRSVFDIVREESVNTPNQPYQPEEFFRKNSATFTPSDTVGKGELCLHFDDEDVSGPFEFDVEYAPNRWFPLSNGILRQEVEEGTIPEDVNFGDYSGVHLSLFPSETRVGFRGPMIEWSKLHLCPSVKWTTM